MPGDPDALAHARTSQRQRCDRDLPAGDTDHLLAEFGAIPVLADRGFPTTELVAPSEPWYLVSNLDAALDLVWLYGQRICCEQLFRDQKSGLFQLEQMA